MSNFKDMVLEDIKDVFLNTDEFAELLTVHYDGNQKEIAVLLDTVSSDERKILAGDYGVGIYKVDALAYIAQSDLGVVPEVGAILAFGEYEEQKYIIQTVDDEMGMLVLGIRRFGT